MPHVVVIAGPNGAGKSTAAPALLHELLNIEHFVNADTIARGLSAFNPEGAAVPAGRLMLQRLRELAERRSDFAFETTLASRAFAPWLAELILDGYAFWLLYLWVSTPDLCSARVAQRVAAGGHHIPDETVVRRYWAGLRNFMELYRPLTERWEVYDSSGLGGAELVAIGQQNQTLEVYDTSVWNSVERGLEHARHT